MKILAIIANYGLKNEKYLEILVKEYKIFPCNVDIIVLSNVEKKVPENVKLLIGLPTKDPWSLPFAYKPELVKNVGKYDIYIYSEDDTLITYRNVLSFVEMCNVLPDDEIAGFIRYEIGTNGDCYYSTIFGAYHWIPESVKKIGNCYFAQLTNDHSASFIINNKQLDLLLQNKEFLRGPSKGKYDMLVTAATEPYTVGGLKKVIPISRIEDFTLHHLPNKYWDAKLIPIVKKSIVDTQIKTMISNYNRPSGNRTFIKTDLLLENIQWHKKYYDYEDNVLQGLVGNKKQSIFSFGMGCGLNEIRLCNSGHSVSAYPIDNIIGKYAENFGVKVKYDMKDFGGDNYDLIILNDILQFFKNPEEIINTLSKLLHRSGRIIGSVSNHMELKNILSLIIHNEMTGDMIKMKKFQTSGLRCMNVFKLKKVFHHCGYKLENIEYGMSEKKFRLNNTFSGILSFVLSDVIYFNAIEKNIKIGVQPSKEG